MNYHGHKFKISPECIDKTKRESAENFVIYFYFILVMQLLGKGLQTMTTVLGLELLKEIMMFGKEFKIKWVSVSNCLSRKLTKRGGNQSLWHFANC